MDRVQQGRKRNMLHACGKGDEMRWVCGEELFAGDGARGFSGVIMNANIARNVANKAVRGLCERVGCEIRVGKLEERAKGWRDSNFFLGVGV